MAEQFRAVTQRFCTSVFLLCAGVCLSPLAFSAPVSGDIDGDGLVGLADALRIVRHIDNVELLSGDALGRADVYPVADGDGVVDVNDARTILRVAVGSISLQEVTGETEWDAPRITSFSPLHGGPGTQVVISGENFPHSAVQSGSVVVAFNHTLASITSSTTTSLTVTVPDDAISGLLRVLTPGGLAVSGTNFTVTNLRNGSLELGGRAAPDAYEVATPYGTSAVGGDGSFQVDLPDDGVGLVGAVPIGPGASYLALQLPGEGTRGTLVVDAQSTAETLVFMHPFLMTDNGDRATMIVNIVTSDAAVAQLAQTISTRYPEGADGLDDAEVRAAWADAVASVLSQLPDTRTIGAIRRSRSAAGTTAGVAAQRTTITTPTGTKIRILRMDPDYFKLGYDAEEQAIVPSLERDYSPVDWLLSITRLDPDSLPNGVSGGPGEGFSDLKKRDMDQLGNYQKTCMVAANQWTAKLDVLGQGMDFVLDSAFDFVGLGGEDGMLPLEDADEDSLYIIRAYSGAWKDHLKLTGDDVVAINAIAGAPRLAHTALGVNATLALLDAWSLVAGDEAGFKQEAIKAGAQAAIDEAAHKIGDHALGGMTEREALQVILDVTVAAGRGVAGTAAEAGLASAQEKLIKTAAKALTGAGAILEALSTLSTLGRIGERVSGEMGYLINVYGLEMSPGPSPMESTFVMVGDPFSPAITSVTPMEAAPGATVTIRGTRFDPRPTYNTVLFNDKYKGTITAASAEELTVVVPIDAPPAECTVSVATQRGFVKAIYTDFELIALPTLLSLSPTKGFGLSPNASSSPYSGYSTRITLAGLHLIDNAVTDIKLYIKGVDVTVGATWSNEQVSFNCPAVAFGPDAEIVLTYMHDEQLKNTDTFLFHVYGPPSLQTVTPTEVTTASVVTVASGALHTSELYIEDQKYSWRSMAGTGEAERQFNMPDLALDDGEEVTLTIWNPAGKTEETLTWSTRIEANPPDDLADGMTFHVSTTAAGMSPDGKLTLAEALAASRGNLNLWGNGYDDFDETAVYTWKQSREPIPDTDPVEYEYTMGFMGVANSVSTTNRAGHEIMGIRAVVDYFSGEDSDQAVGTINLDTGAENYSLPFAEATKPYPPERTFAEEEGDRVTGVKGDHGANHRDTIDTTLTGTSENLLQFEVPAFNLGVQDRLILGYSAITVAGAAAVGEKSVLSVAEFTTTTPLQLASFSGVNTTLTTI
ncbi:MAG: IPT/TIG domain-containing protein, partial [Lentisphaeria bacterium]|nr:IPT/TIG domain-containing protein [Lentisphaeria bacterium]